MQIYNLISVEEIKNRIRFIVLHSTLSYAGATLIVTVILGKSGFSRIPFVNAAVYIYIAIASLFLFSPDVKLKKTTALFLFILFYSFASSFAIGVYSGNSFLYILSWSIYFLIGLYLFITWGRPIGRPIKTRYKTDLADDRRAFLGLVTLISISAFLEDDLYQYPLFLTAVFFGMIFSQAKFRIGYTALFLIMHLDLSGQGGLVAISRASLMSTIVLCFVYFVYMRKLVTLILSALALSVVLLGAISAPQNMIDDLPRNLREGLMILRGDDVSNYVSTEQRLYEIDMVRREFEHAGPLDLLFGRGIGRTINMIGSDDDSVANNSLAGISAVHNIHVLPVAIFHKMGILGVLLLCLIICRITLAFFADSIRGRPSRELLFCYLYFFSALVYGLPASNHFLANPVWPSLIGVLLAGRESRIGIVGYNNARQQVRASA